MRYLVILILSLASFSTVFGQSRSSKDRDKWEQEMFQAKSEYVAKKLQLTDEQRKVFVPLYESMDKETEAIERSVRHQEREVVEKGAAARDSDYEKVSSALFELSIKRGQVEKKYYGKFKSILTPRQLFELKGAEREFARKVMDKHRQSRKIGPIKKVAKSKSNN